MRLAAIVAVLCAPTAALSAPGAYTFGGFSPGGRELWKRASRGEDLACSPVPGDGGQPICRSVERKEVKGWVKPPRVREADGVPLAVSVEDGERVVLTAGDRRVGAYAPGERVTSVNSNLFVSPDGGVVAVEYTVAGLAGRRTDVVGFALAAAEPAEEKTKPSRPVGSPSPAGANAYERAMKRGGVWEQRLIACDQARVTLELKKTRAFGVRIETRCQGDKQITELDGKWTTEGDDTVVLQFENEEGPAEHMVCRFAACEDVPEDCLTCGDEDVSFTLKVVRR